MPIGSKDLPDSEEPNSLEAEVPRLWAEGKLNEVAHAGITRQKANGLAVTFLSEDSIVRQHPDGREEVIATLARRPEWTPSHTLAAKYE